mmetsp:Transcript_1157/g.2055  ORF Transcript_1157/g.2055 Transcript_1157/m.2055 type:complete len:247 (+) Transcript_1157:184-924(+)|eukprot:CAMPEP_0198231448 /NCGR_PEP_ID=MMETSP1445-20131203/115205_1 /TAXON_ID=36898 /ORGANISM="Pyramimonas sp., Strain CCMP2087" /LENGTH=246 /DNA_ID=CAMNT_0043912063 /DNA_START=635 /DNA_END=1375 /DNA_ORIENTATION=-
MASSEQPSTPRGLEDIRLRSVSELSKDEASCSDRSQQNKEQQLPTRQENTAQPSTCKHCSTKANKALEDLQSDRLAPFECNICFELANDAVITLCGHMYCWVCLYRWVSRGHQECPVCKGVVDKDNVIPLYGRGETSSRTDTSAATCAFSKAITTPTPNRPSSQRTSLNTERVQGSGGANNDGTGTGGYGFNLFAGNFLQRGNVGGTSGLESFAQEQLTPEMQQQVFLSRVLLMLGSFVIMCLLLF